MCNSVKASIERSILILTVIGVGTVGAFQMQPKQASATSSDCGVCCSYSKGSVCSAHGECCMDAEYAPGQCAELE